MSRTQQSKRRLVWGNLWFGKNNYMGKFLSPESKEIIEKIRQKYELRDIHNPRKAKGRASRKSRR